MKYVLPLIILVQCGFIGTAQEKNAASDSDFHYRGLTRDECPREFQTYINSDSLRSRAVLLVLNESLHPLGRHEFLDAGVRVKKLNIPIRMNRCTMLYVDSGLHRYHTTYQQLKQPVNYEAGKIYLARLFSRTQWPLGGISIIKKNDKGEAVEYAAVLFEYITAATAIQLYSRMRKKGILMNE